MERWNARREETSRVVVRTVWYVTGMSARPLVGHSQQATRSQLSTWIHSVTQNTGSTYCSRKGLFLSTVSGGGPLFVPFYSVRYRPKHVMSRVSFHVSSHSCDSTLIHYSQYSIQYSITTTVLWIQYYSTKCHQVCTARARSLQSSYSILCVDVVCTLVQTVLYTHSVLEHTDITRT